jgi:high affinity Mn2+ porin
MQPVKTRLPLGIALVPTLFAACGIAALAQSTTAEMPSPTPAPTPTVTAQPQVGASESRELERPERWSVHVQTTNVQLYHGAFPAAYSGPQSLSSAPDTAKTFDFTVYLGGRLWKGSEFYVNQEIDQGFGIGSPGPNNTYNGSFGSAGYVNGEAFKLGQHKPYGRLHRYFIRQTLNLGGEKQHLDADINQLGEPIDADHLILTFGKFSATDVFDGNAYAHDPKGDFLNWSLIDMGGWDYAADAWGFTRGFTAELTRSRSTVRAGIFQLSALPNQSAISTSFLRQFSGVLEFEQRTSLFGGRPGSLKALVYGDNGFMAPLSDATAAAAGTGNPPDLAQFRTNKHWKFGGGINIQQEIAPHVGFFSRISGMNGTYEAFDYTEIDRSVSAGFSLDGALWKRPKDTIGIAGVVNALSVPGQRYFAAGGLGITIGDGNLSYAPERIFETYYKVGVGKGVAISGDYQRLVNPGYNAARGPVSVYGFRLHAQM